MQIPQLTLANGIKIPQLGFGTYKLVGSSVLDNLQPQQRLVCPSFADFSDNYLT